MTGLTPATTYVFKMRACNGPNRCSDWTANHTFTTLAGTVTPGRVTNLRHSSSGDNSVTLAWNAPGNSAAAAVTGYHVQHRPLESDWPGDGVDVVQGAGTTTFTVSQLVDGTIYEFQVQACNAAGCGAWTDLLHPDHVIVAGHKVGNASLIPASASLAVGGRLGVGIHDIPKGKVAYAQMYGAIQPAGRCSTTRGTRDVARAPSASTGSGYYDTVNIEGCAPGGIGWLRVVNAAETELYARATITVVRKPDQVVLDPFTNISQTEFTVNWQEPFNGGKALTRYEILVRQSGLGWPADGDAMTLGGTVRSHTVTGRTATTTYVVKVRACNGDNADSCGPWSVDGRVTTTGGPGASVTPPTTTVPPPPTCTGLSGSTSSAPLGQPSNLTVVLKPDEEAELRWDPVPGATKYIVEIRRREPSGWTPGSTVTPTWTGWGAPDLQSGQETSGDVTQNCYPFTLTSIQTISNMTSERQGLNYSRAYGFRVKAHRPNPSDPMNSTIATSPELVLIDTPILSANGFSPPDDGMGAPEGQVRLEWMPVGRILEDDYAPGTYAFHVRRLARGHDHPSWIGTEPTHGDVRLVASTTTRDNVPDTLTETIDELVMNEVHGIRTVFRQANGTIVISARESYVWPSNTLATGGQRVATFPLLFSVNEYLGHPATYTYRICENQFPPGARTVEWKKLIAHALWQWELATNGIVKAGYVGKDCADFSGPIGEVEMEYRSVRPLLSDSNPLPMTEFDNLRKFVNKIIGIRLIHDKDNDQSEIILIQTNAAPYKYLREIHVFPEVAAELGAARCIFNPDTPACAHQTGIGGSDVKTDILIKFEMFSGKSLDVPGTVDILGNGVPWPRESYVRLSQCDSTNPDDFRAYSTLVHETGHAFGISGISIPDSTWALWVAGHPTVDNSVMNYDGLQPSASGAPLRPVVKDQACAPTPLDVLAITSLYRRR